MKKLLKETTMNGPYVHTMFKSLRDSSNIFTNFTTNAKFKSENQSAQTR